MELDLLDIEEIALKQYKQLWISQYFSKDKQLILSILWEQNSFMKGEKSVSTLQWLSVNICSHINKNIHEIIENTNDRFLLTRLDIKSDIALKLQQDKISKLIEILNKFPSWYKWSPSTLEAIWRNDTRKRNPKIKVDITFNETEIREANNLKTWFSSHIRKYDKSNESLINWDRIIIELRNNWENTLAEAFEYKSIVNNFQK